MFLCVHRVVEWKWYFIEMWARRGKKRKSVTAEEHGDKKVATWFNTVNKGKQLYEHKSDNSLRV